MGNVMLRKSHVTCTLGHPHHDIDDAKSCQDYYSTRLKEDEQLKQMDKMMYYNRATHSYHPYKNNSSNIQATTGPRKKEDTLGSDEAPASKVIQEDQEIKQKNGHPPGTNETETLEKEESITPPCETNKGGLSRLIVFRNADEFVCPLHHKHRSQVEADDCRKKSEEQQTLKHENRMNSKIHRGQSNGLLNDTKHKLNGSPPDDSDDVD